MFATTTQRIFLSIFVFVILAIPIGAYFFSEQLGKIEEKPNIERTITQEPVKDSSSGAKELEQSTSKSSQTTPAPQTSELPAVSFGPTLNINVSLEGRPKTYQAARLFVGIAEGEKVAKPKYLLIFNVDTNAEGIYTGLSLAGLSSGSTYTAYIKGPAQIDNASTFVMAPSITSLNSGLPLTLLTGDLNEDNVINSADYSIASSKFGINENSPNWNSIIDFNRDGVINTVDLSFIVKNFGKAGASGTITSTPSQASGSAQLNIPQGASSSNPPPNPPGENKGYWIWMPGL